MLTIEKRNISNSLFLKTALYQADNLLSWAAGCKHEVFKHILLANISWHASKGGKK